MIDRSNEWIRQWLHFQLFQQWMCVCFVLESTTRRAAISSERRWKGWTSSAASREARTHVKSIWAAMHKWVWYNCYWRGELLTGYYWTGVICADQFLFYRQSIIGLTGSGGCLIEMFCLAVELIFGASTNIWKVHYFLNWLFCLQGEN